MMSAAIALVWLAAPGVVVAQTLSLGANIATVTTAGPVFLLPDEAREPLRVLPVGISLQIGQIKGDWVQVTFNDPQFGRRTGWIQRRFIQMDPTPPPGRLELKAPQIPQAGPSERQPSVARRPAQTAQPIGVRGFASFAADKMAADQSFKAITGSDVPSSIGGGVQVTNLFAGWFAEVAAERSSSDGERVFRHDGEVFRLGIPVQIITTPIDLIGGWRSPPIDRAIVFAGAGVTFLSFKETSQFADSSENVEERSTGIVVVAGLEARVWRWVHVRGDMRYRRIGDVLGAGGVSAQFGERTFGGFGASLKVAVGR